SLKRKTVQNDHTAFEEKQYTDIWNNDDFLQFMYERLIILRELLSENGCIYVHMDWRVNSYMKLIMDEIFGVSNFRNNVVWHYGGRMMHRVSQFNRKHDVILFYSKSQNYYFNLPKDKVDFDEYAKSRHEKIHVDENGKRYL